MLKRQQGHALTNREQQRLASRMQAEDQTGKEGGSVTQPLPREQDPNDAYARGRASVRQLFNPSSLTPNTPSTGLTPAAPGSRPGLRATINGFTDNGQPVPAQPGTPTTSAAQQTESANPLTGTNNQVPGGASVPVAPPPRTGLTPAPRFASPANPAPGHGGIDVNSYVGSRYASPAMPNGDDNPDAAQPIPGYQPKTTSEDSANNVLEGRAQVSNGGPGSAPPKDASAPASITVGGKSLPATDDQAKAGNYGGIGKYRQQFSNPTSAAIYDGYVKNLFSNQDAGTSPSQPQTPMTPVRRAPPTTGRASPSDEM